MLVGFEPGPCDQKPFVPFRERKPVSTFKKYPFAEPTTPAKRTNIIKDYTLTEIEAEYDSASNAEINEKLKENEDSLRWIVNLYVTVE